MHGMQDVHQQLRAAQHSVVCRAPAAQPRGSMLSCRTELPFLLHQAAMSYPALMSHPTAKKKHACKLQTNTDEVGYPPKGCSKYRLHLIWMSYSSKILSATFRAAWEILLPHQGKGYLKRIKSDSLILKVDFLRHKQRLKRKRLAGC